MKFTKPPLNISDQADLLIHRGMYVPNKQELVDFLYKVNYYRFSGYCYIYKQVDPLTGAESFRPGTNLETIKNQYEFDRQLRLILMDAIDRIEVTFLRTWLVEIHSCQHGPFGYTELKNFNPHFPQKEHKKLLREIKSDELRSCEEFINRYRAKYSEEKYLPLWMAVEVMSFGQLFTFYRNIDKNLKKSLSNRLRLFPPVVDSWLHTLNYVRNACAHHVRVWNRPLPIKPLWPDKKHDPDWFIPIPISNSHIFAALTIIRYMLRFTDPYCDWHNSILALFSKFPTIPIGLMGIPNNWQESNLWK